MATRERANWYSVALPGISFVIWLCLFLCHIEPECRPSNPARGCGPYFAWRWRRIRPSSCQIRPMTRDQRIDGNVGESGELVRRPCKQGAQRESQRPPELMGNPAMTESGELLCAVLNC